MTIYRRKTEAITICIVHCSDSDNTDHDNIETITRWHIERGFDDIGYHYFIKKSGEIQVGRALEIVGAHVEGFNSESVGICLSGNRNFTDDQMVSAAKLIDSLYLFLPNLKKKFGVLPHRFFNPNKTCPNFELSRIFKHMTANHAVGMTGKYL